MPEKLKRILQNKNWRSWKKSDWLLLALAGICLLFACDCTAGGEWGWHSRKGI